MFIGLRPLINHAYSQIYNYDNLQRLTSDLNTERDRRLQAENAQELEKVALANLQQELDLERKNLRSTESEYKARIKQLSTAVELERAKSNDLQG